MPTVQEILDFNVERQGGPKGTTNLRQTIAWLDANLGALTEVVKALPRLEAIVHGVYNTPVGRRGEGMTGETTLAATLAWLDGNLGRIINQAGGASVDPEVVRSAVTAAVEKALGGTALDPQVTAKAVREEFRATPLS